MRISLKLSRIQPSATLAINAKAQELKAQGKPVISLAVGEPDSPTPEHVKQAARQALDDNFTRYTPVPGIPELRDAVGGYFGRFYGVTPPREAVIVSNGGKQVLYNLFTALLNPGEQVLIPAPYWVSYPDMVLLAGGEPVAVPTEPEDDFLVSVEALEKARTPLTRALVLNSPSNPTGCCYSKAQLDAIMEWAVGRGIFVISDEIYDQLVYPPAERLSVVHWWERHPEKVAVVNGLAKSFAMTGWRIGYCVAHPDLIKAQSKIQGQSTSNVCSFAQKGAVAALTGSFDCVEQMRQGFERRRNLAMEIVSSWEGVKCPNPGGAFYLFPDVSARFNAQTPDSASLCKRILEEALVALVPGSAFGDDRCLRFSYAVSDETLLKALEAVGKVLKG
ncbi:Aspartate aminotransferase [Fundidesulfovibrio magnetotacticus]|uniref:Aminotransferase n=1 Tax=Fundidesulfovibrio magnetotacticus TaxID=2730080 RepID=A0A6V8LJU1_9BACT|nr:pyridoxal phosphate-dependent aminotransferase [Fundidesulfovibrio magnetotacticus]GFK92983.1 Aspartate aminotransferase [Fundidesulfovibrio magnetotacticus]